jgi:uncharacterized protein
MDAIRVRRRAGFTERPMTDDLDAPLGRQQTAKTPRRRSPAIALAALIALAGVFLWRVAHTPATGGAPVAVARIEPEQPDPASAVPPAPPPAAEPPPTAADEADGERVSGVKITRRGEGGGTARVIHVEPVSGIRLPPAPDRRVVEKGRYGPLPKVSADGARPMDVYARPFVAGPTLREGAPRLALVIGGMGLNAGASLQAIDDLPEAATLAFAPYGADVPSLAAQARERGHETLLQAPMEPFDYPQNNPGPHTLVTGAGDRTVDDLHWLMSRFAGYAGVMNYLGGRFTADANALSGAMDEIATRGLFYLDDGASPQSRAEALARSLALPFARVDVTIDARATPQAMEAALTRLETLAREKGSAIGFANATPATITRLSRFTRDLERRGIALTPVSALARTGATAKADAFK